MAGTDIRPQRGRDGDDPAPGADTYAVDATTDAGKRDVSVSVDPASAHRVTASTEAGNVTVSST